MTAEIHDAEIIPTVEPGPSRTVPVLVLVLAAAIGAAAGWYVFGGGAGEISAATLNPPLIDLP
ncbi:MAG: hypothetical protein GC191_19175 [Azospirillum sp.]|nr:hypothetical protein [Azospirillum sp.]